MTERTTSELEITPERLSVLRQEIASMREEKGREKETLQLIEKVRPEAVKLGEYEHVVNLYWEEYLVGKHILMYARDSKGLKPSKIYNMASGFIRMRSSAKKAQEYIEEHSIDILRARSHRFLGEVAMIESASLKRPAKKAEEHFGQAVEEFKQSPDFGQRVNALELSGFLAEAMVLNGKVDEGIEIAKSIFKAYDEGDGLTLKEKDYFTWAIWKSGCATKISHALVHKGAELSNNRRGEITQMLEEAESILIQPEGVEIWAKDFQIRKDDVVAVKSSLSQN